MLVGGVEKSTNIIKDWNTVIPIKVSIVNGKKLTLQVERAGTNYCSCHSAWGDARLCK